MGIDSFVVAAMAVWVAGFGMASARLAIRLDRAGPVWFVYGAFLGPVALAILRLAPPGLCRSCSEPTRGWLPICWWCGEDVRAVPPKTMALLRRMSSEPSADREQDLEPPAALEPEPPPVRRAGRPVRPRLTRSPGPVSLEPMVDQAQTNGTRPDVTRPTVTWPDVEQSPPVAPVAPVERWEPWPAAQATQRAARGDAGQSVVNEVLATGVYVTGRTSLEPGRRYAIAINGSRLRFLGPIDIDPSAIALDRMLADVSATAMDGRLIISEPSKSNIVLAFMAIAGTTPDHLAATIVRAARASVNGS